jgi:hypothetical protein
LSTKAKVPRLVLVAAGVKTTLIVQFDPTWSVTWQLFVSEKAPLAVMLVNVTTAGPGFVTVTGIGVLGMPTFVFGNVIDVVESVKGEATPVPLSVTICGLVGTLSVKVNAPVVAPPAVGVNTTLTVQLVAGFRGTEQLSVSEKAPLALMLEMVSVVAPPFVTTTGIGPLATPTVTWPKAIVGVERVRVVVIPVPVS